MLLKTITCITLLGLSCNLFADYANKKDLQAALKKANSGDPEKMLLVSQFYETGGNGFQNNESESLRWLEKAVNANYNPAITQYTEYLYNQNDSDKIIKVLNKGVANNNYVSKYNLAMHYCNGVVVKKDTQKCAELLEQITNKKVENYQLDEYDLHGYWAVVEAHAHLMSMYANGTITGKKEIEKSNETLNHLKAWLDYSFRQDGVEPDRNYGNIKSAFVKIGDKYNSKDNNGFGGYKYDPKKAKEFYNLGLQLGPKFKWDGSVFKERLQTLPRT